MKEYERYLEEGQQQTIRRGSKPAGGWKNRTVIVLNEHDQALISAEAELPRKFPHGGSGGGTTPPPELPPDPPPAPETSGIQGYARVWFVANGKSGGSLSVDDIHTPAADATVYNCTTFTQLKTALMASGKRFIKLLGSANFDGAGASFTVTHGDFTVDGAGTTKAVKDYKIVYKCSNVILTQTKWAPGEGSTASASSDRRGISFNPGNDGTAIHGIAVDHCSVMWGPDVVGSFINNTEDATVQYSLIGPALHDSNVPDGFSAGKEKGYGWNVTTPGNSDPSTIYTKRLTFYRNLYALNKQRNLKYEHTLGVDAVNNVVNNYGNQDPVRGNFRAGNIVGNIFKKGPETQASNSGFEHDSGYDQYADSIYHDDNIGITAAGGSFTPTWSNITGAALRATPYDGGPTDADHGALTVDTADATLFSDVVANAGRTYEDSVDATIKAHVIAGTSDGYYNGAGFAAPHPSWP